VPQSCLKFSQLQFFWGGGNYPTPSSLISDGHLSTIFRLEWIVSRNFFLTIKDQFEWTLYCNWNQTKLIQLWNIILDVYQAVIRVLLEPDSHMSPTSAMPIVVDHWWVKSFVYVLLHWSQTMASSATYENPAKRIILVNGASPAPHEQLHKGQFILAELPGLDILPTYDCAS
jgi:hypothetical protein